MFANLYAVLVAASFVCVVAFVNFFLPLLQKRRRGKHFFQNVDGIKPHWLIGNIREVQPNAKSFNYLCSLMKDFPKISELWLGPFTWYCCIYHPHVLPAILNTAEPKDMFGYGFLSDWIGDGLLISSGKKWQRNRRLLTKAFHFDILKEYHIIFNRCAKEMLNKWCKIDQAEKIEVFNDVSLMTLDGLLRCIMSCETHCQTRKNGNAYVNAVFAISQIIMKRVFNPLIHNNFIFYLTPMGRKFKAYCDEIHDFDEKMIEERKALIKAIILKNNTKNSDAANEIDVEQYQRLSGKSLDFLDILLLTRVICCLEVYHVRLNKEGNLEIIRSLESGSTYCCNFFYTRLCVTAVSGVTFHCQDEDGKGLSDREVRDEVDTFLFEGHDTTASAISWAFYCLAKYPECQEKCREDVLNAIGKTDDVTGSDLAKLSYLTMFVKEVMRLYPPVFSIARNTSKPINFPRGFGNDQRCLDSTPPSNSSRVVGPSTNINALIYMIHRNPSVWDEPEVFDPLRFTQENIKTRSSFAYVPFSAGPRNCIGKSFAMSEIKITICKALQRFRFYVDEDCPEPEILPSLTLKSKDGIYVKMAPI